MKRILLPIALVALLGSPGTSAASPGGTNPDGTRPFAVVPFGGGATYALVEAGASAPDFAYETLAGSPARLRNLREQGHVLLVFGAREAELRRLESEAAALLRLGIVPVAVLDWRVGACRGIVKRLSLTFPVVPDPQRVIGAQYNVLDPDTRHDAPAWFVVDREGRVRGLERFQWPHESWVNVAATSLALPTGDAPAPASHESK